jgi:peptidase E
MSLWTTGASGSEGRSTALICETDDHHHIMGKRVCSLNILATSAAFRPARREGMRPSPVLEYAVEIAEVTGRRPKVCMLHTALGDDARWIAMTYAAFAGHRPDIELSHMALFPMPNVEDPRAHLLSQDVIWVGGGSVANLLAVWRVHGVDQIMREAWESNVVLTGVSAGSLCWHVGGTTDSFGPELQPVTNGLGFLPYSNTPHYNSEEQRRPLYQSLVASGELPSGWATDDGVGLHFAGTELVDVVSDRPDAYAWQVEAAVSGDDAGILETRITPRQLDQP